LSLRASPEKIGADDPRYAALVRRDFNKRSVGRPDYVRLVGSTQDVVQAVQDAVAEGRRLVVRSGGHCLEGFVSDPAVRAVIDTSLMTGVGYDAERGAFVVEAGTTLGEMYRRLYLGWGVVLPAGESPAIGAGGHIVGGAFGFLCRQHGLAADHLYAVEVVVVDADGAARSVVATREPSDPNRDLWWAHTGGGGGNFGIVTRYWLRSPQATGTDPRSLLPKAPESVLVFRATWQWEDMDKAAVTGLLRNFCRWAEAHSEAGSPYAALYSLFFLRRRQAATLELKGVSTAGSEAERLFDEHLAALTSGVGARHSRATERMPWLAFALNPFPELFGVGMDNALFKAKDAYLRRPLTDRQLEVVYDYLTRTDHDVPGGALGVVTYGGQVNTVTPEATAVAQRDSIASMACNIGWGSPAEEAASLAWVRAFYRDLFAETGGVPAPGGLADGAMINHPDADLADPQLNTSGMPWHALYYKDNYPRLQRVKARWDPRNVFHHALSVRVG
jgi:FAD/FMN-containing dehydrogenase